MAIHCLASTRFLLTHRLELRTIPRVAAEGVGAGGAKVYNELENLAAILRSLVKYFTNLFHFSASRFFFFLAVYLLKFSLS